MTDDKAVMQQALDALVMVRDAGVTEHALTANQWNVVYNAISPLFELIERSETFAQPEQAINMEFNGAFREGCKECAQENKSRADNIEWRESIRRGKDLLAVIARTEINAKGTT